MSGGQNFSVLMMDVPVNLNSSQFIFNSKRQGNSALFHQLCRMCMMMYKSQKPRSENMHLSRLVAPFV